MLKIIQRITIGLLLLLIMPFSIWLSGWTWQPGENENILFIMYWITKTVAHPWGVFTSFILTSCILCCVRFNWRCMIILFIIINSTLLAEQYTKSYLKKQMHIQRPYIVWIEKKYNINQNEFYHLTNQKKSNIIFFLLKDDTKLPKWLQKYWAIETDFSFPSGHTIFASSWALFFIGLLQPSRHFFKIVVLFFWAYLVMISRLLLGMHWPKDLFVGVLISWLFIIFAVLCIYFFKILIIKDKKQFNNNYRL